MTIYGVTFPIFEYYFTKNRQKSVDLNQKNRIEKYTNDMYKMSKYTEPQSAIMRIYQIVLLNYTIVINYVQLHVR